MPGTKKTRRGGRHGQGGTKNIPTDEVRSLISAIPGTNHQLIISKLMKLPLAESYDLLVAAVDQVILGALINLLHHVTYVKLLHSLSTKVKNECAVAYGARSNQYDPVTPLENDVLAKKQHFLTFTQFVVVLYEYNVVSYSVMLNSCNQLLPDSDDIGQLDQVKLECLSILLTSYVNINGNVLSHLNTVEPFFKRLRELCEKKAASARVRTAMWRTVGYYDAAVAAASSPAVKSVTAKQPVSEKPQKDRATSSGPVQDLSTSLGAVTLRSPPKNNSVVIKKEPTSEISTSSYASFHSIDDNSSQEGSVKSWALPLIPIVLKVDNSTTFDKLVEVYEMRLRNNQYLQESEGKSLVKDSGLTKPNFCYLQWMRVNASSTLADTSASLSTAVGKFLSEAEHSLKEHMRAYHKTVEEAAGEKINELVEGLPANSRAEMNRKAYGTALAKIQS